MTDNKLRSALIYRLDQDGSTVCVAKYDYAGQYEQNGGLDIESGVFYDRNQSYADAVAAVIYNDKPRGLQQPQELGGFKFVQSEQHQITYGADMDGLCCAVITGPQYPSRVAITMLQDLYTEFTNKYGEAAKTAHENALSRKAKTILKNICKRYDDPASVDQTQRVLQQVDAVKGQMHANIATMLQNTETAESMTLKSEQLNEQASVFKKRSTDLRKQMKWKNTKMTIIFVVFLLAIITAITVPLVQKTKKMVGAVHHPINVVITSGPTLAPTPEYVINKVPGTGMYATLAPTTAVRTSTVSTTDPKTETTQVPTTPSSSQSKV